MMTKHFVTFYSPGTFVAEQTTKEIDGWVVGNAIRMAEGITERYGAKPYAFQFWSRERGPDDFEPKESGRSPMYFINCEERTIEEIEAEGDPGNDILISNMRSNGWDRVAQTTKGWRWTQPLRANDIVL